MPHASRGPPAAPAAPSTDCEIVTEITSYGKIPMPARGGGAWRHGRQTQHCTRRLAPCAWESSPLWKGRTVPKCSSGSLLWFDLLVRGSHLLDPAAGKNRSGSDKPVGAVTPRRTGPPSRDQLFARSLTLRQAPRSSWQRSSPDRRRGRGKRLSDAPSREQDLALCIPTTRPGLSEGQRSVTRRTASFRDFWIDRTAAVTFSSCGESPTFCCQREQCL